MLEMNFTKFCVALCWKMNVYTTILFFETKFMYSQTLRAFVLKQCELMIEALHLILRKFHEITIFPLLIWIYLQIIIFIIIKQTQPFIQNSACALILYILTWLSARGWKECALQRANINKWFFQLFPTVVTSSTNYKLFI